MAATVILKN